MKIYNIRNELLLEIPGNTLRGADLHGRDLREANLRCADLREAKLWTTNLEAPTCLMLTFAKLYSTGQASYGPGCKMPTCDTPMGGGMSTGNKLQRMLTVNMELLRSYTTIGKGAVERDYYPHADRTRQFSTIIEY